MPRKYAVSMDLTLKEHHDGFHTLSKISPSLGYTSVKDAERTGGKTGAANSSGTNNSNTVAQADALAAKRRAKAMSLATKPGQQILMNAFMMYMSGSTLNIFSISTTSMAILSPIGSLFKIESTFANLEVDTSMPKLIFVVSNLAWLALGLYKMSSMRLLPLTSADWTDSIVWKDMMETSSIPPAI